LQRIHFSIEKKIIRKRAREGQINIDLKKENIVRKDGGWNWLRIVSSDGSSLAH
jgi:hypothetical protein